MSTAKQKTEMKKALDSLPGDHDFELVEDWSPVEGSTMERCVWRDKDGEEVVNERLIL